VEEGEEQGPDVRPVHIGIGHDHDAMVACPVDVKVLADPGPDGRDQGLDLDILEDLVLGGLLDVQYLAPEREDGLELPVPSLLRASPGRIPSTIYISDFSGLRSEQSASLPEDRRSQSPFPPGQFPGVPGRLPGPGSREGFFNNDLEDFRSRRNIPERSGMTSESVIPSRCCSQSLILVWPSNRGLPS
jgi:hypothetical protein